MILEIPGIQSPVRPGKVLCIGRNYAAHAKEMNSSVPSSPMVFLKPSSALITAGEHIVIPDQSKEVHHEVEMVLAIGRSGKSIRPTDAMSHVCAYAVGLDLTARDLQSVAKKKGHPWSVSKGFDGFAPIGEFTPALDISDPHNLGIQLSVNGEIRQLGNTSQMIFRIPELIAHCSSIFTLEVGDLIYTGTPEGVSPIESGDSLVASMTGVKDLMMEVA